MNLPRDRYRLLFWAIVVVAVAARLFGLVVFPDAGLNDGVLHLTMARSLADPAYDLYLGEDFFMPPPLQHFALSSFFAFTGLPWSEALLKVFPFLLSALFLYGSYRLFRGLFGRGYLLPFAFVAINPWLVIYFSVNYTEAFAVTALVFAMLLALRFVRRPGFASAVLFGLSVGVLALSKLNGTVLAGFLSLGVVALVLVRSRKWFGSRLRAFGVALAFAVSSAVLPLLWFVSEYVRFGYFILPDIGGNFFAYAPSEPLNPVLAFGQSVFLSVLDFWGFPVLGTASRAVPAHLLAPAMGLFFLLVLPLTAIVLWGVYRMVRDRKNRDFFALALLVMAAGAGFIVTHGNPFLVGEPLYWRYFVPALPLVAIPFASGARDLFSRVSFRRLAPLGALCFALFAAYAALYSGYFAAHFAGTHGAYGELYAFLDDRPGEAGVFVSDLGRQVSFFSAAEVCAASTWDTDVSRDPKARVFYAPPEDALKLLREGGCTHVVTTAYRDAWPEAQVDALVAAGVLEKVFEHERFSVYEVR